MNRSVPLVAHVIHRLQTGGLENGLVNLINHMPPDRYRHAIICMTEYTDFRERIQLDVPVFALHKRQGKDPAVYFRFWKLLRQLQPDLLHTRNIGTLECILPALLAGVSHRVHGEHGRDIADLHGLNRKYNLLRRIYSPLVSRFIALSKDLEFWLQSQVGIPARKVVQIYNGVDTELFRPARDSTPSASARTGDLRDTVTIGYVGRMQAEKDPLNLVHAFIRLAESMGEDRSRLRLAMIGEGQLRAAVSATLRDAGYADLAWVPGDQGNVQDLYRSFDIFVLPSLGEGISNTILEAMSSGLPVVATDVGGNPELVVENQTGFLVPPDDPVAMADAIRKYVSDRQLMLQHGAAARLRAVAEFGISTMAGRYLSLYDQVLGR